MWTWTSRFLILSLNWLICKISPMILPSQPLKAIVRIRCGKGGKVHDSLWRAIYIWRISTTLYLTPVKAVDTRTGRGRKNQILIVWTLRLLEDGEGHIFTHCLFPGFHIGGFYPMSDCICLGSQVTWIARKQWQKREFQMKPNFIHWFYMSYYMVEGVK